MSRRRSANPGWRRLFSIFSRRRRRFRRSNVFDIPLLALERVRAPTLLIVGGHDYPVIGLNCEAEQRLKVESELVIVPRATHLFEEPGAVDQIIAHASQWFLTHLLQTKRHSA